MKLLNTKYIIETVKTRIADKTASTQDYILYAIARAYRNAKSEGEAAYLSAKYVLALSSTVTNQNKLLYQFNNDPFFTIRSVLKGIAVAKLGGYLQQGAVYRWHRKCFPEITEQDTETLNFAAKRLIEAFNRQYLYIFVRQDICVEQQAVQAAHATFVAGAHLKTARAEFDPTYTNFVLIGVPGKEELAFLLSELTLAAPHLNRSGFWEEDLNDEITALAVGPVKQQDRDIFKGFPLLKAYNTRTPDDRKSN